MLLLWILKPILLFSLYTAYLFDSVSSAVFLVLYVCLFVKFLAIFIIEINILEFGWWRLVHFFGDFRIS